MEMKEGLSRRVYWAAVVIGVVQTSTRMKLELGPYEGESTSSRALPHISFRENLSHLPAGIIGFRYHKVGGSVK